MPISTLNRRGKCSPSTVNVGRTPSAQSAARALTDRRGFATIAPSWRSTITFNLIGSVVRARSQGARGGSIESRSDQSIARGLQVSVRDSATVTVSDARCLGSPNRACGKRNFVARDSERRSIAKRLTIASNSRRRPNPATQTALHVGGFGSRGKQVANPVHGLR
jgi:hypothetical protein